MVTLAPDPGRDRIVEMLQLTRREKFVVAFVLSAFLAGLGIKHWRDGRAVENFTEAAAGR